MQPFDQRIRDLLRTVLAVFDTLFVVGHGQGATRSA